MWFSGLTSTYDTGSHGSIPGQGMCQGAESIPTVRCAGGIWSIIISHH